MRFYVIFFILPILTKNVNAIRILAMFPHPGKSHQMVFEPLFHELALRGHNITVVSFYPIKDPPVNYRDISLEGLFPLMINVLDIPLFEQTDLWGFERIATHLFAFSPLADITLNICQKLCEHPPVQELLRSAESFDLILVENFDSDCALGLTYQYKAPVIALLSHALMAWSSNRLGVPDNPSYIPAMDTHFTENMDFLQRVENTLVVNYHKIWYRYAIQSKEQRIIEHHLGHKIPNLEDLAQNTSLMLINTHYSLNGVRPLVPGTVEVGGMHLPGRNKSEKLPSNVEKFIADSKEGVILFSFGTLLKAHTMSTEKLEIFTKVLSRFPQRVIWKWETEENTIDGKILKMKWLPQYTLLHHPNVIAFIAHGGLLGMTEAVDAGVPMLVIPFFGDQPLNAAAAADAGLATVLPLGKLSEETLYAALKKVLSPEMRESAKRVSRVWHDRPMPPLETAVYWVERTARLGHDARMASRARHMPAYQLALLDVYAFLIACASLIIYIIYAFIRTIVRFVLSLVFKKKIKVN